MSKRWRVSFEVDARTPSEHQAATEVPIPPDRDGPSDANSPARVFVDGKNCVSFEEFNLYYLTTEKVTDQRIATNRWNYSVCIALIVAIAVLVKFASDKSNYLIVGLLGVFTLSFIAFKFCRFWLAQIEDAKRLNAAKFSVLNEMAKRLNFGELKNAASYEPFDREWILLEAKKAATNIKQLNNQVALSASRGELYIPRTFMNIFVGIAALSAVAAFVALVAPPARPYLPVATQPGTSTSPQAPTSIPMTPGPVQTPTPVTTTTPNTPTTGQTT